MRDGQVAFQKGDLAHAQRSFEFAHEIVETPELLIDLGAVADAQGDLERARSFFSSALKYDRHSAIALGNLATVDARQGQNDAALKHFEQALEIAPENYRIRGNYGSFLVDTGIDTDRGLIELQKAREIRLVVVGDRKESASLKNIQQQADRLQDKNLGVTDVLRKLEILPPS